MAERGPRLPDSGENTEHLIPNPECSCPQCDSLVCFTRRQINKPCSCLKCENSKTCLYFPHKGSTKGDLTDVKTSMEGDDILAKERVKREITYEFNEASKTRSTSKHINNAMFSGDKGGEVAQKDTNDLLSTQVENVANDIPQKEHDSAAAKLSAQIMDVPYENLHDIINKDSDTTSHKILVLDVLNKIRDAYKACSCKVCECLVGTSTVPKNNLCKCEPCDCNDCMSFMTKFQYLESLEKDPPDGCPCIRCTRSQCKGIVNKFDEPQICDCPPGYSIKCQKNYAKSCSCEPCQCLECKAMSLKVLKTFIVAPVGEEYQRHYCDCSPCECLECRGYGIPRTYVREAETNVNRHPRCHCETCDSEACIADGAQTCKCLRRSRVMVKPIEKDVRDYDIRTIITENKIIRSTKSNLLRNSTIAMYATVPNIYNNTSHQKECSCEVCECVICNCKENAVDSIKSSRLFKDKIQCLAKLNSNVCKCTPCDCLICVNKMHNRSKSTTTPKSCKCSVCDCINCESVMKDDNKFKSCVNVIKRNCTRKSCRCSSCECIKCIKSITCAGDVCRCRKYSCELCAHESKESIYPIKKAEPLTPSSFSCEIHRDNSKNYNGDKLFVKDFGSLSSTKLFHLNITSQNDTCSGHPQNDLLGNGIESCTSNKETHLFPQSKYDKYQDKVQLKSIDTNICKHNTTSQTRNIYVQCSKTNYAHCRTNASDGSVLADSKNYKYSRAAPVATEDKLCNNSGDSGCGSYDYFTPFPGSSQADGQINQESDQYYEAANPYPNDKNINMAQKIKQTHNANTFIVNENRHHHSFESENKYYFSREEIEDVSINNSRNHKTENISQEIYGRQYWTKKMDVSQYDLNYPCNKHSSSIDYDSKNNSADNTNLLRNSDENLSYSQYIDDHSLNLRDKPVEDLFNNDAYYEGVQKTLHRARAFSLELLKVLDKYQRANNEFQSITQKLKASHASLFSDNILQVMESKEDDVICLSPESSDIKPEHEDDIPLENKYTEQKRLLFSFSNDFKGHDRKERCTQIENWSVFNVSNDRILDEGKPESPGEFSHLYNVKSNKKRLNECNRKIRGIKKTNKCNTGTLKQIIKISKEGQSTTTSNRVMKTIASTQTALQGKKYEEASTDAFSLSTSYLLTGERTVAMKNLEILPISKKNFYLITKPVARNKGICIIPSLQGDIKQAVRSMSIQTKTSNNENKFAPRRNEALQNLQVEVQKLLGMPILQNTQKILCDYKEQNTTFLPQTKIDIFPNLLTSTSTPYQFRHDVESFGNANKAMDCKSDKSCCEALKVNFLGLQRVSDHTVIVKWTAPRITSDVTGYELLVDGRAVQKILSPSRCVAVVTCLPHCETVLLTIRTITSLTPSGHFPSSTIVYHPRVK
ncbi:uncharacterized protein LOC115441004 isoform X1 [Manduca sexta]|uniref:uncharacterized protein LOC115441004 isoform X1 n=1 Tax=Manduca sexta TaxID=7130 RepID=UPI00188F0F85|nr:uncharacterized protein LOC115441004 isoform X1 [Manduca sexta]XP_037296345.1 uncharacterized protein LOC115441004 isoform X1 [Manduca sexta]